MTTSASSGSHPSPGTTDAMGSSTPADAEATAAKDKPKNKGGRPKLPESAYAKVLEGLQDGLSLRKVCKRKGCASVKRVLLRVQSEPDGFGAQYAGARHVGLLQMEEEMLQMADGDGVSEKDPKLANAAVQRDRLRIDTRKWLMSKMRPERYGDRVALTGDSRGEPIRISDEAAARELALILATAAARMKAAEASGAAELRRAEDAVEFNRNRLN